MSRRFPDRDYWYLVYSENYGYMIRSFPEKRDWGTIISGPSTYGELSKMRAELEDVEEVMES